MATLLVHDNRVVGNSPRDLADEVIRVGSNFPLQTMINQVLRFANNHGGRISHLYILAHGIYRNLHSEGLQRAFRTGGCGIEICHENLLIGNLGVLSAWRGKISRITLFSCGIAAVDSQVRQSSEQIRSRGNGLVSTHYDAVNGEYFCQQFANACDAEVIAADREQEYGRYRDPIDIYITGNQGNIDSQTLLQMEGNIRTFRPQR